jgi:hypothetical protein
MLRSATAGTLLTLTCASAVLLVSCKPNHERFIEERRAEIVGYRISFAPKEKEFVLHRPDGTKDVVSVPNMARVMLYKQLARHSNDHKDHWYWWLQSTDHRWAAPYFAAAPSEVIAILARELPDFDEAAALRMAHQFERDKAAYCQVWLSQDYLKQPGATRETGCR